MGGRAIHFPSTESNQMEILDTNPPNKMMFEFVEDAFGRCWGRFGGQCRGGGWRGFGGNLGETSGAIGGGWSEILSTFLGGKKTCAQTLILVNSILVKLFSFLVVSS